MIINGSLFSYLCSLDKAWEQTHDQFVQKFSTKRKLDNNKDSEINPVLQIS